MRWIYTRSLQVATCAPVRYLDVRNMWENYPNQSDMTLNFMDTFAIYLRNLVWYCLITNSLGMEILLTFYIYRYSSSCERVPI
jgi:hypothetical protein